LGDGISAGLNAKGVIMPDTDDLTESELEDLIATNPEAWYEYAMQNMALEEVLYA